MNTAAPAQQPDEPAVDQLKRFTDTADRIRANAASGAKALGAVGAAAVGAVGVVNFSDVFPVVGQWWSWLLVFGVVAGVLAMGAGVLLLTMVTWHVGDPVFVRADPAKMTEDDARQVAEEVYRDVTGDEPSLLKLQEEANRAEEDAKQPRKSKEERAELRAEAAVIWRRIRVTQARVVAEVVRKRSKEARRPFVAFGTASLFAVGLVASGLCADALSAQRTEAEDNARTAKACADAVQALTANDMPVAELSPGCSLPTSVEEESMKPAHRAETLDALVREYRSCVAANDEERCTWIVELVGS